MCGGYIVGDGGDEDKNKGAKVNKNIFNNQQGLEAVMDDRGGRGPDGGPSRLMTTAYAIHCP
jgi:hypothetical protein